MLLHTGVTKTGHADKLYTALASRSIATLTALFVTYPTKTEFFMNASANYPGPTYEGLLSDRLPLAPSAVDAGERIRMPST